MHDYQTKSVVDVQVKLWTTFNEPYEVCKTGYALGQFAPGLRQEGVAEYLCAHTILQAHARAYHLYRDKFAASQQGAHAQCRTGPVLCLNVDKRTVTRRYSRRPFMSIESLS